MLPDGTGGGKCVCPSLFKLSSRVSLAALRTCASLSVAAWGGEPRPPGVCVPRQRARLRRVGRATRRALSSCAQPCRFHGYGAPSAIIDARALTCAL